jgi:hypothetical protein
MGILLISRSIGVFFLSILWLILYMREKRWWILLTGVLGIIMLLTGLSLGARYEKFSSIMSLGYVFLVVSTAVMAQAAGFRSSRPISLGSPVMILLIVIGFIIIGSTSVVLAKLAFS